ncbi:hypothetical protein LOAG_08737, partial [Loa loa]
EMEWGMRKFLSTVLQQQFAPLFLKTYSGRMVYLTIKLTTKCSLQQLQMRSYLFSLHRDGTAQDEKIHSLAIVAGSTRGFIFHGKAPKHGEQEVSVFESCD